MTHKSRSCKEEKIMSSRGAKTRTSDLPFLRYDALPLIYREPVGALDQLLLISVQLSPGISRVYSVMG